MRRFTPVSSKFGRGKSRAIILPMTLQSIMAEASANAEASASNEINDEWQSEWESLKRVIHRRRSIRRYTPQPRATGSRQSVPAGPVLSARGGTHRDPSVAPTQRRYPRTYPAPTRPCGKRSENAAENYQRLRLGAPLQLRFPGQCPRTSKPDRTRVHPRSNAGNLSG